MWSRGVARWFRWDLSVGGPFVCRYLIIPTLQTGGEFSRLHWFAFRGLSSCCLPGGSDRGFPHQRRLLPPSFLPGRSPFPRSDITTVATEQAPPMGLSHIATSAKHRCTGPFPPPEYTRLQRYYEPLRHPSQPGLSLTRCQLIRPAITAGTSRVAYGPLAACRRQ